jgi:hypothetical protein
MRNHNIQITPCRASFEDLLSGLTETGIYSHLRLILTKNNNRELGQKYLMICRSGFAKVKLLDIEYCENQICMALQDTCTGMIKNVHLDVNDPAFRFLLISWDDILTLAKTANAKTLNNNDLLEFDY